MKRFKWSLWIALTAFVIAMSPLCLCGCSSSDKTGDDASADDDGADVGEVVLVGDGTSHDGDRPSSSDDANAPVITDVLAPQAFINGGSGVFTITYDDPDGIDTVTQLIVTVEGSSGYFTFDIPAGQGSGVVTITLSQDYIDPSVILNFAVVDSSGLVSEYVRREVNVLQTGTGDVKVSLSWDLLTDVDLHVVEPDGEEIFYASRNSTTGGELDLDSNPACNIDGVNNENIYWPDGAAPTGHYIVRVDYWANCETVDLVNFVVTVIIDDLITTYNGVLNPSDADAGSTGAGVLVTEFDY